MNSAQLRPGTRRPRGRVVFVGAVHESVPTLAALQNSALVDVVGVVTPPPERTAGLSGAVDLRGLVDARHTELIETSDINAASTVDRIASLDPDLMVVAGWTRLLGDTVLGVPRHGCVGFHASVLPHNRGRAPVNWAILRGERTAGNTMMLLDPGVDTGDIVDQASLPIGPDDTCATVYARVAQAGVDMLLRHLPGLLTGTAPRRPQPPQGDGVLPKRTPQMGILDWDRSAQEVHDWVRALTKPYPGAFTTHAGRRLGIWASARPTPDPAGTAPGTVLSLDSRGAWVATRQGRVLITSAGIEDGEPTRPDEALEAVGIGVGSRFEAVDPAVASWALGLTQLGEDR